MNSDNFWDDQRKSGQIISELNCLKKQIENFNNINSDINNALKTMGSNKVKRLL